MFWKAGYAGTSLDDLSAATGMNRPSLYAAFGDKRDLYLKTLEHYRDEWRALARAALADDPPLRVFLKRFYDKALDLYLEDGPRGCYSIGTAATVAAVDDQVRAVSRRQHAHRPTLPERQIEKAQRARRDCARRRRRRRWPSCDRDLAHAGGALARRHARKELDALADAAIGSFAAGRDDRLRLRAAFRRSTGHPDGQQRRDAQRQLM